MQIDINLDDIQNFEVLDSVVKKIIESIEQPEYIKYMITLFGNITNLDRFIKDTSIWIHEAIYGACTNPNNTIIGPEIRRKDIDNRVYVFYIGEKASVDAYILPFGVKPPTYKHYPYTTLLNNDECSGNTEFQ